MPTADKLGYTAEEVIDDYRKGYRTAAEKNELLRKRVEATLADTLDEKGYFGAILTQTIKHVQEGWDNFKEGAGNDGTVKGTLKGAGLAVWGQIQVLTSVMNAFGEVNGAKAEQIAKQFGASPGLAKVINVAVDVGSGFIPMGKAMQSAVKGATPYVQKMAGTAAKAGSAASTAATAAAAAQKVKEAETVVEKAIASGLARDGVKLAEAADDFVGPPTRAENFYKALRRFKSEMADITATKGHDVTLAEAEKLGIGLEDLQRLAPGTALKEAEMAAYLKALDGPTDELITLAKATVAGDANAGNALLQHAQDFFTYAPKFRAAEVTAGRSVEILKETPPMKAITDMLAAWDPESIAKMDIAAATRTMAEDIVALADEPGKLKALQIGTGAAVAESGWKRGLAMARETYINLLLARPVTQVRNFLGNSFAAVNSSVERELAGWLSIDDAKGVVKGEGLRQVQGMTAALADGIKAFGDAYKRIDPADLSKLDFVPHQIPGPLGRIINAPGDTLRGMDNFFKTLLQKGDMYAQASRQGSHLGLEGKELAGYIARRVAMPTSHMIERAQEFALNQTFSNDLGTIGKAAQRLMQAGPLAIFFPFTKAPMQLAKYSWNRTPGLNLLSKSLFDDIAAGGARADMAIGRLTLSNMMGMFWYGLAQQGLITGGGPVDPELKRSWGKQPYSIMHNGNYYPFTGIEPGTTTVNLVADFAEIRNQLDDPTAEQTAMAIALAGTRDIVDKSYWQTVGQMVDFVSAVRTGEEPGKNALRLIQGPLVAVGSGGPLVAGIERVIDPVRREARGFMDQVRSRIPGFSADLPPMRDGYGDPMMPPQALGNKWLEMASPFVYKPEETDPIKKEGSRLQIKLPKFPWSIGGKSLDDFDIKAGIPGDALPVELTPQQRDRWQVLYRNILRHPELGVETMMNSPEYQNGTEAFQRDKFASYLALARNSAKQALLAEDIPLAKRSAQAMAGKYLPLLQPEQRPAAEASVAESLDLLETLLPKERENLMRWGIYESGEARDNSIMRLEITKPIADLNAQAAQEAAQQGTR